MHDLREETPMSDGAVAYVTVRLNGLLQTDDAIALREIARQLCLEQHIENPAFVRSLVVAHR